MVWESPLCFSNPLPEFLFLLIESNFQKSQVFHKSYSLTFQICIYACPQLFCFPIKRITKFLEKTITLSNLKLICGTACILEFSNKTFGSFVGVALEIFSCNGFALIYILKHINSKLWLLKDKCSKSTVTSCKELLQGSRRASPLNA